MRKQLFTVAAVLLSLCGYAQTKGTNALSLSVTATSSKNEANIPSGSDSQKVKNNYFGIDLLYLNNTSKSSNSTSDNTTKGYGAAVSYQKYYPLIGKFYAYAGGSGGFSHTQMTYDDPANENEVKRNEYTLGAHGGITCFLTKRWAFETRLLSASSYYTDIDQTDGSGTGSIFKSNQTAFNLSTNGFINDLGFKIYLMF